MEETKIRVCFVSPKAYPLFNPDCEAVFGGAEVDLYLIAAELAKDEHFDVRFVVGDYGQPKMEQREGVTLIKSLDVDKNMILQGGKVWSALRRADADIYMHEACSLGTTLVALFCKIHKRQFVYRTAHTHETDGTYFKQHRFGGLLFLRSLKNANQVIVQNHSDTETLKAYGISSVPIPNAHRPYFPAALERKWILWVGRSADFKRPERFLELARAFPNEAFVMICPQATGDSRYTELKNVIKTIPNLIFYERVGFREIDSYFAQARVYVNTSDSEGFPNTFIQACKTGTCILSFHVNPDNFLNLHRCGLDCGGNFEKLKENLAFLLENDRCLELGRNGFEYCKQKHDLLNITGIYKALFKKLCPHAKTRA